MSKKIKLSLFATALLVGSLSFPAVSFADNQEPILIEISDTDIGTTAFEQLIAHGNGGHAAIGAILGNAQNMLSNPGIGFSIGSGGNGYRPSIIIAVWTDQPFSVSSGLDTIKSHFNVPSNPITTNGDCAIACDGTTQVEEVVTTTTTTIVATTTTLPQVVEPTQVSQSPQTTHPPQPQPQEVLVLTNTQPYIAPTTTTTTLVENVNVSSAYASFFLTEKLITPISKPKVVNKTKKTIRKKTHATIKKAKQNKR